MNRHITILVCLLLVAAPGARAPAQSAVALVRDSQENAARGNVDAALEQAAKAVETDPAYAPGWRQLGVLYMRDRRFGRAAKALATASKLDPKNAAVPLDLARAQWYSGARKDAVATLEKALALDPGNAVAWRDLGRWHWDTGSKNAAIKAMVRSVKLERGDAQGWHDLARWYWVTGSRAAALAAMDTAAELQPVNAGLHREYARWLWTAEQGKDAVRRMRAVVKQTPDDAGAWRDLGRWLWALGKKDDALPAMRRAVKLAPDNAGLWRDVGWAAWNRGLHDEAIAALRQAVKKNVVGRDKVVVQLLAAVSEAGRAKEAVELARELLPDRPLSQAAMAVFETGRARASLPLFAAAWNEEKRTPEAGLYLAYVRGIGGATAGVISYVQPFIDRQLDSATPEQLDVLMEILHAARPSAQLDPIVTKVDAKIGGTPKYGRQLTAMMALSAAGHLAARREEQALRLYRRVTARDPTHVSWFAATQVSLRLEQPIRTRAMLAELGKKTSSPAVQFGVQGMLAVMDDDKPGALAAFRKSLEQEPNQPEMRLETYRLALAQGEIEEATKQAAWFNKRIESGGAEYRSYLAEMWTGLGETSKALDQWERLSLSAPHIPYYGVEAARAYFQLGSPGQALAVLEGLLHHTRNAIVFETIVEIHTALAAPEKAFNWAARGLKLSPTQNLRRQYCETAEVLGRYNEQTLATARAYLAEDAGYVPLALIEGRCLHELGRHKEARALHKALLARNPSFIPGLRWLRDDATRTRDFAAAKGFAKRVHDLTPEDPEAMRRLAVTHAEGEEYRTALKTLRKLAKREPHADTPVLVYRGMVKHPYPGRVRTAQVRSHVEKLRASGYVFAVPTDLRTPAGGPRVLLVFEDLSAPVTDAVDDILHDNNARAVYAAGTSVLLKRTPGMPGPTQLKNMVNSGRWVIATRGAHGLRRVVINDEGNRGNPLTHRLYDKNRESMDGFATRIGSILDEAARGVSDPRVLVYPFGDSGHVSLDTSPRELTTLDKAVADRFAYALFYDDTGFYNSEQGTHRVPAKRVSPAWSSRDLLAHLRENNPGARARLELAKVLQWHRQHEDADHWFRVAQEAGANPADLNLNWSANAFYAGDFDLAREKLADAVSSGAPFEKTDALARRIEAEHRPHLALEANGWDDNEGRDAGSYGIRADAWLHDRIAIEGFGSYDDWGHVDLGDENGVRYGAGVWLLLPYSIQMNARGWQLELDEAPTGNRFNDFTGWDATLRMPCRFLNGYLGANVSRHEVETVEALRAGIYSDDYSLYIYSRIRDLWDVYGRATLLTRSGGAINDNDTAQFTGRIVRRFKERPYLGVGYRFRIADSDFDPDEYWAPEEFEQHQLYATARGDITERLSGSVSAETGYAQEQDEDWDFKWGGQSRLDYKARALTIGVGVSYFEGPIYERLSWNGTVGITF